MPELEIITRDDYPEIHELAAKVIDARRPVLRQVKIVYVWLHKLEPKGRRILLGKCQVVSPLNKLLSGHDYAVYLNAAAWAKLNAHQREALLFHELRHAAPEWDLKGKLRRKLAPHDCEEFREVVEHYGMYLRDVEELVHAAQYGPQPTLFEQAAQPGGAAACDETWRAVPLAALAIPPKYLEALKTAGVETVGQLADYSASGKPLSQVKGIGESGEAKIEAALEEFWRSRKPKQ